MDETRSATPIPAPDALDVSSPKVTRDTRAVPTDHTPGESREYPEVPGYEILGTLGHGGMGVVYRARQLKANRLVALKMIRAVEHAGAHDRLRFQIETEAVARLQHPHIVQLHEVGEVRGQPFFSLEFCDGGTLAEQLKKKRLSPSESAQLIETLARAMHYAHLRGVVHRDLKPGNVLLAACGLAGNDSELADKPQAAKMVPKITDFGLAKRIDDEARDVSKSGAIMGTASYMAPEQAAGKVRDTGPAADVYALGALLYECLTGQPPFDGPRHTVLLSVLSDEPVPPSRLAPKIPHDLETICLKCLHKEPTRRYASAEALADDLRHFQAGEPVQARPISRVERSAKWAKRRPALAGLLGVSLLALIALAMLSAIALRKENAARQEADKAKKARDFLISIFRISEKDIQAGNITARQILSDAERRIPKEFADQPELGAELLAVIEDVNRTLGQSTPAAMILEVRGSLRLLSATGTPKHAAPQALLFGGDRLSLVGDAAVKLLFLADLHQETVERAKEATIGLKGCTPADAVSRRDDGLMMTFVRLKKGTFYMGGGGGKAGRKTQIKEGFEIAVHTVTQGQWQAVMGENPGYFSRLGGGRNSILDISDEELMLVPVETVSWEDVQGFIKKLNEREKSNGWLYRLPSEAEWEYACRGGASSEAECSYHFYFAKPTNRLSSEQANFNGRFPFPLDQAPQGEFKYLAKPTRVGAYPPNKLGLCDMHGNVWQWCADLWRDSDRVARGGSWNDEGADCQAATRYGGPPTYRYANRGFRLVRVPVP